MNNVALLESLGVDVDAYDFEDFSEINNMEVDTEGFREFFNPIITLIRTYDSSLNKARENINNARFVSNRRRFDVPYMVDGTSKKGMSDAKARAKSGDVMRAFDSMIRNIELFIQHTENMEELMSLAVKKDKEGYRKKAEELNKTGIYSLLKRGILGKRTWIAPGVAVEGAKIAKSHAGNTAATYVRYLTSANIYSLILADMCHVAGVRVFYTRIHKASVKGTYDEKFYNELEGKVRKLMDTAVEFAEKFEKFHNRYYEFRHDKSMFSMVFYRREMRVTKLILKAAASLAEWGSGELNTFK